MSEQARPRVETVRNIHKLHISNGIDERHYYGEVEIELPSDAKIIFFAIQFGRRTIWYETAWGINPGVQYQKRRLFVAGTGNPENFGKGAPGAGWRHVQSFYEPGPHPEDYVYVWHLYEEVE